MKLFVIVSAALALLSASSVATVESNEISYSLDNNSQDYDFEDFDIEDYDFEDYDFEEVFAEAALENSCNKKCKVDADCHTGGFVQCGKCGQYSGTRYYHRCYEETPSPTPSPIAPVGRGCGGQRKPSCRGSSRINMCCPTGHGTSKTWKCVSSGGGMRAICPAPAPAPGKDCGGQRKRSCRGRSKIAMCCPTRRGTSKTWKCVNSGGGMQAHCPGEDEDELEFLEVDTE